MAVLAQLRVSTIRENTRRGLAHTPSRPRWRPTHRHDTQQDRHRVRRRRLGFLEVVSRQSPNPRRPGEIGSSPLAWGKLRELIEAAGTKGFIPTRAGKMWNWRTRSLKAGVHPHSRGENLITRYHSGYAQGSSPLARGKFLATLSQCGQARFIPTRAGKISSTPFPPRGGQVHPHSRGENVDALAGLVGGEGSSPLARGK